jgi:hypothetical protein
MGEGGIKMVQLYIAELRKGIVRPDNESKLAHRTSGKDLCEKFRQQRGFFEDEHEAAASVAAKRIDDRQVMP